MRPRLTELASLSTALRGGMIWRFVSLGFSRGGIVAAQLIFLRFATSYLAPAELGRFYLLSAACNWVNSVLFLPPQRYIGRQTLQWAGRGRLLNRHAYYLLHSFITSCIFTLGYRLMDKSMPGRMVLAMSALFGYCLGIAIQPVAAEALNIVGSTRGFIFSQQLEAWLRVGGSIAVLLYRREMMAFNLLLAHGAAKIISAAVSYVWLLIIGETGANSKISEGIANESSALKVKRIMSFAAPLAVGTVLAWGSTEGYKYALALTTGIAQVGIFVANYNLVLGVFGTFDAITSQTLTPQFWRRVHAGGPASTKFAVDYFRRIFRPLLFSAAICALLGLLLARNHLMSSQYHVSAAIILMLCFEETLRLASHPEYFGIMALGNTGALISPYFLGATVAIGLTLVLGRLQPLSGPALALILGSGVQSLLIIKAYRQGESSSRKLQVDHSVGVLPA